MRIEFYAIVTRFQTEPLQLVCRICEKACAAGQPLAVLVDDQETAEALDQLLWEFKPDAYVPHQIAGDEDDEYTAVLIVPPGAPHGPRPLWINLRDAAAPDGAERLIELIPADDAAKTAARQRWRAYQARGHQPQRVEI
jgi:DNA polymerase-3 subunit chi